MRIGHYIWISILLILAVVAFYFVLPAFRDYKAARHDLADMRTQIDKQEQEIRRLKREITALRTDRIAVERIAREKFGWCRDGEKIYHFDPPSRNSPADAQKPDITFSSSH